MKINKGQLYNLVQLITPPIIFSSLKNSKLYPKINALVSSVIKRDRFTPEWHEVTGGILKGRKIFVDANGYGKGMLSGDYDDFFFDYLKKIDLKGRVVYDIGAHIGFSSLCFAELVGSGGKVIAFEPNVFNKERIEYILGENKDLAQRIAVYDVAVSDKAGEEDFVFSDNVDNGTSSGSFIDSAHTFFEKGFYETGIGFKRVKTKTIPMDMFETIGIKDKPFLIKMDIEGAEYLALEGAKKTLAGCKPILLIEIHSIFNMLKACETLGGLGYKIELLKEESDGRCFISAT